MNKQQLIQELKKEGFSDKILKAFETIKREDFIPEKFKEYAYENEPLPIEEGATMLRIGSAIFGERIYNKE